jgi:hypothetical protein
MRKIVMCALVLLILTAAVPAFSQEIEIGMSFTPVIGDPVTSQEELDFMFGFHFGYSFLYILYASWDALVIPPQTIGEWTGLQRPGFLNLYDAGVKFTIGPVIAYAELGLNSIYVYKQETIGFDPNFGANLRLGVGAKFGWVGITLSGTSVFPSFDYMIGTLKGLIADSTRKTSLGKIKDTIVPSLNVTMYF